MLKKLAILILTIVWETSFAQPYFSANFSDTINKSRVYTVSSIYLGTYISGLTYMSLVWYKDHERVPFHFYNDSKGYLQMDKWGHALSAYRESYAAYYAFRWAGLDHERSLIFGAPAGVIFQTPIEIFDGIYEGWGFSWTDMAANTIGSGLFAVQQAVIGHQPIVMKFSYAPSGYPKYHPILGESELESFFLDYNGHTYWLSANISSLTGLKAMPEWINFAFGYSANGMIKEFKNPEYYMGEPFPHLERYRQYLFSLDIDFTRIKTNKPWLAKVYRSLNILKLPFPTIEFNSSGVKFYGIYY